MNAWPLLWVLMAYLIGSIPFGYVIAKRAKNIDIRQTGSGNMGTTNVMRILGRKYGILVLILDVLKGFLPVCVASLFFHSVWFLTKPLLIVLVAIASVVGHSKSIWLKFYGGKSVATGLGTLLGMAFPVALLGVAIFIIVLWYVRIVSLGSILASLSVPIWMMFFHQPLSYTLYSVALCLLITLRHWANIQRLLKGEEPKLTV